MHPPLAANDTPSTVSPSPPHTQVSQIGGQTIAKTLSGSPSLALMRLNLAYNKLNHVAVGALFTSLLSNTTVTELDLGWNGCGDGGCEALGKLLEGNRTMRRLFLGYNHIGNAGGMMLAGPVKLNQVSEASVD